MNTVHDRARERELAMPPILEVIRAPEDYPCTKLVQRTIECELLRNKQTEIIASCGRRTVEQQIDRHFLSGSQTKPNDNKSKDRQ